MFFMSPLANIVRALQSVPGTLIEEDGRYSIVLHKVCPNFVLPFCMLYKNLKNIQFYTIKN